MFETAVRVCHDDDKSLCLEVTASVNSVKTANNNSSHCWPRQFAPLLALVFHNERIVCL